MNETKKIIIILIAILIVGGITIGVSISSASAKEKNLDNAIELVEDEKMHILFLGRPTCTYCEQFQPVIDQLTEDYDLKYDYINTDNLTSSGLSTLLKKLNIDEENFGTPYLSITKDGKVVAEQSGYVDRETLFNFLQENGVIAEDVEYKSEYPNLNMIDFSTYKEILESGEKEIVVLGQTGCAYCEQTKPILDEIAEKNDVTINYLNITNITEDEFNELMDSLDYLKELESIGTPLTLIIENKEVVGHQEGYAEESVFENLFKKNGLM